MLHTFEALLNGNILEWTNDAPQQTDRPLKVYVTLLEEPSLSSEIRRQKIAEILGKIAENNALASIKNPVEWQQELRQDRVLPYRDE